MQNIKLLCDRMLIRLARWLRAAGYDTLIANEEWTDRQCLETAQKEERYLVTRDRHFLEFKKGREWVVYLKSNDVESCLRELSAKLPIDWEMNPFTRCMLCNHPFEMKNEFQYCPSCDQLFWEGSHTKHMRAKMKTWNDAEGSEPIP